MFTSAYYFIKLKIAMIPYISVLPNTGKDIYMTIKISNHKQNDKTKSSSNQGRMAPCGPSREIAYYPLAKKAREVLRLENCTTNRAEQSLPKVDCSMHPRLRHSALRGHDKPHSGTERTTQSIHPRSQRERNGRFSRFSRPQARN